MAIEYLGLSSVEGPLVVLEGVQDAFYDEIVEFVVDHKTKKMGRIVELNEDKAIIQVFEGTENMSLDNTHTRLMGRPMEVTVSPEMLGRTFNGIGQPIDDMGPLISVDKRDVNGLPLKVALTVAEYLAFECNMHILVILTDMTSFAEALREVSSSRGEIPSRKGYPGYLYSELATIYERAGIVEGANGSVTQLPILTMPNDDITHPIPDLTGYITEGQIVLDRNLYGQSVYPPINVLPSLSRLMKDGIGEGYTRDDHQALANQLFASYAKVGEARNLASVIGEDELSPLDKKYLEFGREFEQRYIGQGTTENRTIQETLDLGWELLALLPREELDRIDTKLIDFYYPKKNEA